MGLATRLGACGTVPSPCPASACIRPPGTVSSIPSSAAQPIGIGLLEAAINRARLARPAQGVEAVLAREVSVMASLYGRLIWERRSAVSWEELTEAERDAVRQWLSPATPATPGGPAV